MRLLHALLLIPLFTAPVLAETATTGGSEHHGRRSAQEHFADANTTHDGRLTLDQATASYKSIAKAFPQIDVGHHGYVTIEDIKSWKAAKKAARQAAKHAEDDMIDGIVRPGLAIPPGAGPRLFDTSTDMIVPAPVQSPRLGIDMPTAPLDRPKAL